MALCEKSLLAFSMRVSLKEHDITEFMKLSQLECSAFMSVRNAICFSAITGAEDR